ncbi:MAG: hypothetical protein A2144_00695 [Chloroflexi bacterium RBG_16_50_9]|nr:MAG: hypothetical protein A2144_00695 [Chloroflexi bacterium RBG_16_50_9]
MDKKQAHAVIRRAQLESDLKAVCMGTISERVSRYLEVDTIKLTPNAHWASISAECALLYRDGYFFACIALCQAVAEAITRDLCKKNTMRCSKSFEDNINRLHRGDKISLNSKEAMEIIWKNRNDYHHLNPEVPTDKEKLQDISKSKMIALGTVEAEVFEFELVGGAIKPKYPQYWPKNPKGLLEVFLRLEP